MLKDKVNAVLVPAVVCVGVVTTAVRHELHRDVEFVRQFDLREEIAERKYTRAARRFAAAHDAYVKAIAAELERQYKVN